jgi:hypothetical protein
MLRPIESGKSGNPTGSKNPDRSVEPHLQVLVHRLRLRPQPEKDGQVDMRRRCQDQGVGQPNHPAVVFTNILQL